MLFSMKRSCSVEYDMSFCRETHFVYEVFLRHIKERFASKIRKANLPYGV